MPPKSDNNASRSKNYFKYLNFKELFNIIIYTHTKIKL